jgi:hypothetical protein
VLKIFHFGRFDIAALLNAFGVRAAPVYCTKIASKLCRTYTDRHGLKYLIEEMLGIDISKQQQMSDWGAETLTEAQLPMPRRTCCTCTGSRPSSTAGSRARAAPRSPRPASASCRRGPSSIWPAGPKSTSSRIEPCRRLPPARAAGRRRDPGGGAAMSRQDGRTRTVFWLKVLLPLVALGLLSTLFLLARTADPDLALRYADVDVAELSKEEQVAGPAYSGVTRDGASLTASWRPRSAPTPRTPRASMR